MTYTPGVQSFTYRTHTVEEMCDALAETTVEAVELCHEHVLPEDDDGTIATVTDALDAADLDVCGYGVADFDGNPADVRPALELVVALGGEYLSVSFPPDDEAVARALIEGGNEFGIDVAVHNHGPEGVYESVADVTTLLERYPDHRLGACVDTGHFLRAGESPGEAIPVLGGRLHALHLTDHAEGAGEVVPGEGAVDVEELVSLLDAHTAFDRPIVIEYEADPDDPTPVVQRVATAIDDAGDGRD